MSWDYWDVLAYSDIAHYGYRLAQNVVFFPLWPLAIRLFGRGDAGYFFSALVLANVFFYLALVLFFALASCLFDDMVARRALFALALYPYGVFFFTGYTEALFLLLSLAMFYCLQFHHAACWWLAGCFAALATLTRATGLVLIVPYLLFFVQRFLQPETWCKSGWGRKFFVFTPVMLVPLALSCYMLYLDRVWKNPFLFVAAERDGWGRHLALPWLGLVQTVTALVTGYQLFHNLLDLAFTLLPLWLIALSWRRMPIAYACYAIGMAFFSLSNPSVSSEPLTSAPRYMLTIFPCFLLVGLYCEHRFVWRIYLVVSAVLLALFTVFFVHHYWLA